MRGGSASKLEPESLLRSWAKLQVSPLLQEPLAQSLQGLGRRFLRDGEGEGEGDSGDGRANGSASMVDQLFELLESLRFPFWDLSACLQRSVPELL